MHAKPSTRDGVHEQRHIKASASTVKESGTQGTIRLPRAWSKPSQLGRRAVVPGRMSKPRPERTQAHAHLACLEQRRERALEARLEYRQ